MLCESMAVTLLLTLVDKFREAEGRARLGDQAGDHRAPQEVPCQCPPRRGLPIPGTRECVPPWCRLRSNSHACWLGGLGVEDGVSSRILGSLKGLPLVPANQFQKSTQKLFVIREQWKMLSWLQSPIMNAPWVLLPTKKDPTMLSDGGGDTE